MRGFLLLFFVGLLTACGQKGALFLEQTTDTTASTASVPATEEDDDD
jgi:predicted small lipoprotein YifL|tara:strand:+ start:334 stop:474 length:141 start_codon:yes stop_codon:yes gene_type:complete